MNPSRLFLFAILLLGAAVLVSRFPSETLESDAIAPRFDSNPILSVSPDSIVQVTTHFPLMRGQVQLTRSDSELWMLTEPLRDVADSAGVQNLLNGLTRDSTFPKPKEWGSLELKALGLDPPSMTVEVTLETGITHTIGIGVLDRTGDKKAASLDGRVFRIGKGVANLFERPALSWRSPLVFTGGQSVRRIEYFSSPDSAPRVFQKRGSDWYLIQPETALLSNQATSALKRMLRARGTDFPEEMVNAEQAAGMHRGEKWVFYQGNRKFAVYRRGNLALADGRPYLLSVQQGDFGLAYLSDEELPSQRMANLLPNEVVSVKIEVGESIANFRKRASGWYPFGADILPSNLDQSLESIVRELALLERLHSYSAPTREPIARVILSRSQTPQAKSGIQFDIWRVAEGSYLGGVSGEGTVIHLNAQLVKKCAELALVKTH